MLHIPKAFDHLKGSDANFEMVTSNTIQDTRIEYNQNIITKSKAVIFINTSCNKVKFMDKDQQDNALANALSQKVKRNDPDVKNFSKDNLTSDFPRSNLFIIEKLPDDRHREIMRDVFYLPWSNAYERGQYMFDFFTDTMQFKEDDVKKCINFSKDEIINELDKLSIMAYNFDKEQRE